MVENQCESNCECTEMQRSSEMIILQMNVVAKQLQIKQIVHAVVVMTLLLEQNHFWKDPSLLHYRSTCGEIEKEDATKVIENIQH